MNEKFGISIITPTSLNDERVNFLEELYSSIQIAGEHIDYEWILVIDTNAHCPVAYEELFNVLADDSLVKIITTGGNYGAAFARNLGLSVASYDFVTTVDDDDLITEHSLTARLDIATKNPEYKWIGGLLEDLYADGSKVLWDCPAPRGKVSKGELWRIWGHPKDVFPIGPTTLLIDKELLRRVGGWHGLPRAEDFGMVMAVTGKAPGFVLDESVYLYRKHAQQMTKQAGFDELEEKVRHITWQRGQVIAFNN